MAAHPQMLVGRRDPTGGGSRARRSPHAGTERSVKARLCDGEKVFAFFGDICVICAPERVLNVYKILEEEIVAHHGKTQEWNRGSVILQVVET